MKSLGDRIKKYEKTNHYQLLSRTPLMIRVDGRAFHTFTKICNRPFDNHFIDSMIFSALDVSKEMQGFKVAYIQSDEVTFCLTDYDTLTTEGWFDYDLAKVISISASLMTINFNHFFGVNSKGHYPVFDSRAFSIPVDDVVNAFLWRAKDWNRNSIQMYARSFFSAKQLHKKKIPEIHEMLYSIGKNWSTDLDDIKKNGTFIIGKESRYDILPTYESINNAIGNLFFIKEDL